MVNVEGLSLGFSVVGKLSKRKEGKRSKITRRRGKQFARRGKHNGRKRLVQGIKIRVLQEVTMLIKDVDMENSK